MVGGCYGVDNEEPNRDNHEIRKIFKCNEPMDPIKMGMLTTFSEWGNTFVFKSKIVLDESLKLAAKAFGVSFFSFFAAKKKYFFWQRKWKNRFSEQADEKAQGKTVDEIINELAAKTMKEEYDSSSEEEDLTDEEDANEAENPLEFKKAKMEKFGITSIHQYNKFVENEGFCFFLKKVFFFFSLKNFFSKK